MKYTLIALIASCSFVSCKSTKELGTVGDVVYYRVNARTFDGPNITALVEHRDGKCAPSRTEIVATASGPGIGHTVVAAAGGVAEAFIMKDAFGSDTIINNAVSAVSDAASSAAGGTGGRGGNATGGSASNSNSNTATGGTATGGSATNNNSNTANGGAGGAGGQGGDGGRGGNGGSATATGGNGGDASSTSTGGGNGGGNGGNTNVNVNVNQNQGDCRPDRPGC